MNSKTKPVMIILSNLSALIVIASGYYFANKGIVDVRRDHLDGDAIFGGLLLAGGLFFSFIFLLIGMMRKEGNLLYYIFPVVALIDFSIPFLL